MYTLGIDAFSSRRERSGVEWYTHHLLRAMQPITPPEWRVFLYSLDELSAFSFQLSDRWQGKRLRWLPRRGWGQTRLSWEMVRRPPNVLFVPGAALPAMHPHRPSRKQWTVTTIHDAAFLEYPALYAPADRGRQERALEFALHHASLILAPSLATRQTLAHRFPTHPPIAVTPLGVDPAYFAESSPERLHEVLAKYKITSPYILYVGRIDAKKNLPTLIRAFADFSGKQEAGSMKQLVLIGSHGFGAAEVLRAIQSAGITDRVRMPGYVPEEDLPALYSGATAFAFPSSAEGFGLPVLQAMACGIPTIASDIPALRELGGEAVLFARPEDVNAWRAALERVATDASVSASLRERGIVRARDFSWEQCAQRTWQAIVSLLQ